MILNFKLAGRNYFSDLSKPRCISIPLDFHGNQPNTYNVEKAGANAFETSDFIGDTRKGGSCNFEKYSLIAHCNGTHTECVGHISYERIPVNEILSDILIPSTLISVMPERGIDSGDSYNPVFGNEDFVISKKLIESKLKDTGQEFLEGLLIRTIPNDDSKKSRNYMETEPPFFTAEAMQYIHHRNVKHLLVDLPSVDRTFDEGMLTAHHIFWDVKKGSHDIDRNKHSYKTITEMIYAPDFIEDGFYLVNIQIPDFIGDAAPSRIILFDLEES